MEKKGENVRKGSLDRRKQWFQKSLKEAEFLWTNVRATRMEWMGLEKG